MAPRLRVSRRHYVTCFLVAAFLLAAVDALSWLSLGMSGTNMDGLKPRGCRSLNGLTKPQMRLCRKHVQHMDSVRIGAHIAVVECQYQFRKRRWNCTMIDPVSVFGGSLKQGTREAAFVHAVSSAAVAHKVTDDCSNGRLEKCGCDGSVRGSSPDGFRWAGCSDNVHYGVAFSRLFVDVSERRKKQAPDRLLVNMHNNEAGRKAIERNMRVQCKCHGVSGSCELKTCWRAMPTFRQVGDILKEKFDGATEVKMVRRGSRTDIQPVNEYFKRQTSADLVYVDNSPDYCETDAATGTVGTRGRRCNRTSSGIDGCELLCCHRGFDEQVAVAHEMCDCKFHWCCRVKCRKCIKVVHVHTCK